jgi:DNA-binding NtrC family response regulator
MSRVLLVEDDAGLRGELSLLLREEGFAPTAVGRAEEALAEIESSGRPDLLLVDVRLAGLSGVELVRRLAGENGEDGGGRGRPGGAALPPTIVISGEASISETVEALRLGVHDFLEKPFSRERLLRSMRNTLESAALKREVADLRSALGGDRPLLGASPAIERLRGLIERAAPTEAGVLIRGESGTGKELVAEALHRGSRRRERPLLKLNCAAIPEPLVEDELFGHAAGAFTDARGAKPGLFEAADGGTLLLDEIGDMPARLQGRLLRVLEDGRVRRLGETRDRPVDVRVLAATHRDLEAAVEAGDFRADLYYRLARLPIGVPPLRQRPGDVRLLARHFLDHFQRRHRTRPRRFEETALARLEAYSWPGNVRELKNLCERLAVFADDPITVDDLPAAGAAGAGGEPPLLPPDPPALPLRELRTRVEREYIEAVLRRCGWNLTAAARALGLRRTYLYDKLAALGIERPARDSGRDG